MARETKEKSFAPPFIICSVGAVGGVLDTIHGDDSIIDGVMESMIYVGIPLFILWAIFNHSVKAGLGVTSGLLVGLLVWGVAVVPGLWIVAAVLTGVAIAGLIAAYRAGDARS
jgi:hypothetical protein